jgi:hypothetical protein
MLDVFPPNQVLDLALSLGLFWSENFFEVDRACLKILVQIYMFVQSLLNWSL